MLRLLSLIIFLFALVPPVRAATWLAIGRADLLKALEPLMSERRAQGLQVVTSTAPPARAIAECAPAPDFILLCGDETWTREGRRAPSRVASTEQPFYRWDKKQSEVFGSDIAWGDMNHDGVPEVPVGRIPVRTPAGAARAAQKILAWERRTLRADDLTLPVWTGDPRFGEMSRRMAVPLLLTNLRHHAPRWMAWWLIHGDATSPWCGWPGHQRDLWNSRTAGGAFFLAMLGHGAPDHFVSGPGPHYRVSDAKKMASGLPRPPLVIWACSCAAFTRQQRSLAEGSFFAPAGPVCCVAASIESHPLPNYYSSVCFLKELHRPGRRFGEVWISAQAAMKDYCEPEKEEVVAAMEAARHGAKDPALLKRDHLLMYNLIGDPATRFPVPQPLDLTISKEGPGWRWSVMKPAGASRLLVEHRPFFAPAMTCQPAVDSAAADALLERANREFSFTRLEECGPDAKWSGICENSGTLRVIAETSGALYAAGADLE